MISNLNSKVKSFKAMTLFSDLRTKHQIAIAETISFSVFFFFLEKK